MKTRRHHNNTGLRQIRQGKTRGQVQQMAKRLGILYKRKVFIASEIVVVTNKSKL